MIDRPYMLNRIRCVSATVEIVDGLSFGRISANHSLYNSLHDETLTLIIHLDQALGNVQNPIEERESTWDQLMYPMPMPRSEEWPQTVIFPFAWMYGKGQFKKASQSVSVQRYIVQRFLYLWAMGDEKPTAKEGKGYYLHPVQMTKQITDNAEHFEKFTEIQRQWRAADEADVAVTDFLAMGLKEWTDLHPGEDLGDEHAMDLDDRDSDQSRHDAARDLVYQTQSQLIPS